MAAMKILFITATRLGDAILSTGLLNHMLETWPDAKVTVACGPLPVSVFEGFPNVGRIIPMKKKKRNGHWIDLWKQVVGTRWDMVVDLRNSAVSRLILARKYYIFGRRIDKQQHKVEQAAQTMRLSSVPAPKLHFTMDQLKFARALIPSGCTVIAVGPSANWIGKTWPAENFIEVLKETTAPTGPMPNAHIAVFAAPGEEAQARPVLEAFPENRRIDGIAKGAPGEVAAAISLCDFYLGNDSGLLHAAAAAGVPTLGLYGPSYPHLYAPWGDHAGYVCTPKTFDELIDFEGYSAKTLDITLMGGLETATVMNAVKNFEPLYDRLSLHIKPTGTFH
ncbi:MAG: glycosyltransferase family 9 protein [Micavibrio aeruginosavorus]|uniref:Glycosyltransferase family 9 protein n=1 Tax=Micavibrio aeruginosavorus TaxID=349221 RepID=A0A2W5N054_9BACT|nr:MAG: glycosyltransferase family 9 protein [Micavibrio aeruginosavorus]